MLTQLTIRNFKAFEEVVIELGDRVVFVGPNNAGKTSALQALALWELGTRRWLEKRGGDDVPEKRPGVTLNRRDLIAVPVPTARLLWRDLHTQRGTADGGTERVFIEILVEGTPDGAVNHGTTLEPWQFGLEFYYANEESLYCRPLRSSESKRMQVPAAIRELRLSYLPPMSGLAASETRLDEGAINVRLGEGRTAEVLRNLCWQVYDGPHGEERWNRLVERMQALFGIQLDEPAYIKERGEIQMSFRTASGTRLDLSSSGRGQQQTLLLLAHMAMNRGAVLLLDEPDAHLEILRQRQIYDLLSETARETETQLITASHSEVILNEAADRDVVVAFVGKPHRIDDRGSQVAKALKEIGFEQFYQAEETGWVLYVEGSTDLAILHALARRLDHPAKEALGRPFVHYVGNEPSAARNHFYGLREAKKDLVGVALYDRLDKELHESPHLQQLTWKKREIENYLCQRETLLEFADSEGRKQAGPLFGGHWRETMSEVIETVEGALATLGEESPWGPDLKVTDRFLDRVLDRFYATVGLPNLMRKTDYHILVPFVPLDQLDSEIAEKLDAIVEVAGQAKPRRD